MRVFKRFVTINTAAALVALLALAFTVGCAGGRGNVISDDRPSNWTALHELQVPGEGFKVWVEGRRRIRADESLSYRITSARTGRLWVLQVDPGDTFAVVYPNPYARNNRLVTHQPHLIPESGSVWKLFAGKTRGRHLLAFVVTTHETDLEGLARQAGNMEALAAKMERLDDWSMTKLVVEVE